MAVDVGKITQSRQKDRDAVKSSGEETAPITLELQYIADSLEAIREELASLAHLTGAMTSRSSR